MYFDGQPGDSNIKSIWIEPSWLYEREGKYVVGSEDFPYEQENGQSDEEYEKYFEKICRMTNSLIGAKIFDLKINEASNEISLFFDNHQVVRNIFDFEDKDGEGWIYRDHSKGLMVSAFIDRLEKNNLNHRSFI